MKNALILKNISKIFPEVSIKQFPRKTHDGYSYNTKTANFKHH